MKKILAVGVLGLGVVTGVYAKTCDYDQIKSNEYQLTDLSKQYVMTKFFIDPDKDMFARVQRDAKKYVNLKDSKFKVLESGVATKYNERLKTGLKSYRFSDITIDGKAYVLDKSLSTKFVTPNCEVFYLNLENPIDTRTWGASFLKADNSPADTASLLEMVGKSLQPKDTSATVTFDRFEKIVNIQTKEFNNMLLRGIYNPGSKKTSLVQLYLDATFIGNWGGIKLAYDTSGSTHEVVLINHDADCSNKYMGCKLKETLGVTLSEDFLRKNQNGFELKLKGKQDKIIMVSSDLVGSFLGGLNQAKKDYK
ncbi:hypothetical protein VSN93_00685 [Acinetobacter johnsonii]|uniref:hypothetical protein n=1 Tax=Acinetobacter johnsonii TaxID=40214 RepID=UPI003D1677FC